MSSKQINIRWIRTGSEINLIIFKFTIRGKLSIIRCDKELLLNLNKNEQCYYIWYVQASHYISKHDSLSLTIHGFIIEQAI